MMIEVLVSHGGPLFGRHGAEEAVGMGGALFRSSGGEAVEPVEEALLLLGEVAVVALEEALFGGHVVGDRLFAQY